MKKYSVIIFLFLSVACELIVDIEVPFEHAQLTLNSTVTPDSLWSARISLNRHILDEDPFQYINNALVIIYDEDDIPIDTLINSKEGFYRSDNGKPFEGKTYTIRASAENYEPVKAVAEIPFPAQIANVDITETHFNHQFESQINIKFQDDPLENNYYQVVLYVVRERLDFFSHELISERVTVYLENNDPAMQNENFSYNEGILFKDVLFNGKEAELSLKTQGFSVENAGQVVISLRTMNEDFYKYKTTFQLQNETGGDPFAQPVNVYNNIENGFGIFAGYSESTFTITNPRPVVHSFTPSKGKPGDHIIITGENFIPDRMRVLFKGITHPVSAPGISATETQLEIVVPPNAASGKFYVFSGTLAAESPADFEVIN